MNSSTSPTSQHFHTSFTTTAAATATKRRRTTRHLSTTVRSESDYTSSSSNTTATPSPNSLNDYQNYHYYSLQEHIAATCLILLSRSAATNIKAVSKPTNAVINTTNGVSNSTNGAVFECKTCNRVFHSFQALGGHRASHKRPSNNRKRIDSILAVRSPSSSSHHDDDETDGQDESVKEKSSADIGNGSNKVVVVVRVHGCSICGSEFSSGQALGGHMRRHRPPKLPAPSTLHRPIEVESSGSRNVQPLDLNLPAPLDDDDDDDDDDEISLFHDRVLKSTPPLVDCHYS